MGAVRNDDHAAASIDPFDADNVPQRDQIHVVHDAAARAIGAGQVERAALDPAQAGIVNERRFAIGQKQP